MTALYRVRTALTGFPGGPGVATMFFLDKATAVASVRSFWATVAAGMPNIVKMQVENSGDIIESTTGVLTGSWTSDPVLSVQGAQGGPHSGPSGLVVTWLTGTIAGTRRLRGRTFVVPLSGTAYEADGTIADTMLTPARAAAQALVFEQSLSLVVWHRPVTARAATPTSPARAARIGSHGLVTGHRVADKAAVLRSRRD